MCRNRVRKTVKLVPQKVYYLCLNLTPMTRADPVFLDLKVIQYLEALKKINKHKSINTKFATKSSNFK